jgi:hypothetical protein
LPHTAIPEARLPDGQINVVFRLSVVQPPVQKYFPSRLPQIKFRFAPSRLSEGRFAIVTDVRRDAVDADAPLTNGGEADGEVVWF